MLLTGAPCGPIRPLSPGIPLGPLKKEQKVLYLGGYHVRIIKRIGFFHSCRCSLSCPIAEKK